MASTTFVAGAALALALAACGPGPGNDRPTPTGDLTLTITVIGDGRATLADLGFTCTDTCTLGIDEGTDVALVAVPDGGRVLVAWDGPCGPFDHTCTWEADRDRAVTVTFAPHALHFELQGDGEGSFVIDAAGDVAECRESCGVALSTDLMVTIQYDAEGSARTRLDPWIGCDAVDPADTYCLVKVEGATTVGKTWRHPPVAGAVVATVDQATTLTVEPPGVLAEVDDTPGDTHTASLVTAPDHGTLTLSPSGAFTYQPSAAFAGVDTFTFRVIDAFGNTDDATASVHVRPRLTLEKQGDGGVSSDPSGIDCDASCTSDVGHFDVDSTVTLTAAAEPGSTFAFWSGDACAGRTDLTCTVTMDGPKHVEATFRTSDHTVTVSLSGNGNGRVTSDPDGVDTSGGSNSAVFEHGTEVTLTATASGINVFAEWRTGPCAGSTAATCTFTVTSDADVEAMFVRRVLRIGTIGTTHDDAARSDDATLDRPVPASQSTAPPSLPTRWSPHA